MSLIKYHGEIPKFLTDHLTEEGLTKFNPSYDPVLHLPLHQFSETKEMYDKWALTRFRSHGNDLLPMDMRPQYRSDVTEVKVLVFEYEQKFILDSKIGPKGEPLNLDIPLHVGIMNQCFRVGGYLNFKYLPFVIEATVYESKDWDNYSFSPYAITPYVAQIYHHFQVVSGKNIEEKISLFERLEQIVAQTEGIR